MRILIVRSGSGWGGIVSRYLIDTTEKVMIDLYKCFELTKDNKYFNFNVFYLPLSDFQKQACSKYVFNVDLLESFLQSCELHEEPCMIMDHQIDSVYVLDKNNGIRCVYDTDGFIWPENPALCSKLQKLVELCV
jgi:hypothetical protein